MIDPRGVDRSNQRASVISAAIDLEEIPALVQTLAKPAGVDGTRAAMVGQVNAGLFLFYGSLQRRLIIRYLIYKDAGFLYLLGTELTLQPAREPNQPNLTN